MNLFKLALLAMAPLSVLANHNSTHTNITNTTDDDIQPHKHASSGFQFNSPEFIGGAAAGAVVLICVVGICCRTKTCSSPSEAKLAANVTFGKTLAPVFFSGAKQEEQKATSAASVDLDPVSSTSSTQPYTQLNEAVVNVDSQPRP